MTLLSRIEKDYITAYKAKEQVRVGVLRLLKTAAKNRQVELMRELTEEEVLELLTKQAKQRQESIEQYRSAGRDDLADTEAAELAVIKDYLPEQLSEEETAKAVDEAVAAVGASSMQDMGKVMQAVMAQYKGRVDGKALSAHVRSRLSA